MSLRPQPAPAPASPADVRAERGERWREIGVGASIALLPFIVLWRAAFGRGVFHVHDLQFYFYPYHTLAAQLVRQGEWPLWNPMAFSGLPLVGDGQVALFFPLNWLFFVLPPEMALNWIVLLLFATAGLGMYVFLRDRQLGRAAAALGAIAFMFCGFMTGRVVHVWTLANVALLPWVFLCVNRFLSDGGARWFAWSALAVGLHAMSGHPQVPIYTALALLFLAFAHAWGRRQLPGGRAAFWRLPLGLVGVYVLGSLIAAVQLVPLYELARLSPRAAGASYSFIFGNSSGPHDWLLMLFPYAFGALAPGRFSETALSAQGGVDLWEHSVYVGMLPLALAGLVGLRVLARLRRARPAESPPPAAAALTPDQWRLAGYGVALVAFAMVYAMGRFTPLSYLVYHTPILGRFRDVERFMALGDFALATLAALGVHLLLHTPRAGAAAVRRTTALSAALVALVPTAIVLVLQIPAVAARVRPSVVEHVQPGRPNAYLTLAFAFLAAGLLLTLRRRTLGPRARTAVVAGMVVATGLDLGSYAAGFNPLGDAARFRRPPAALAALQSPDKAPFRKVTWLPSNQLDDDTLKESLAVSWGMPFGIEDVNGFNSLQPRRYTDYLFGVGVEDVSYGKLSDARLLRPGNPVLSSLNVRYVLFPRVFAAPVPAHMTLVHENPWVRVYENPDAHPRVFFVDEVLRVDDARQILATVTAEGFDARKAALIEPPPAGEALPPLPAPGRAPTEIDVRTWNATVHRVWTGTSEPRVLVANEMFMPGWRAYIDGSEVPILRANYLFRAVVVPPGKHEVVFRYRPTSVALGAALSLLGLLTLVGLLALARRQAAAPAPASP